MLVTVAESVDALIDASMKDRRGLFVFLPPNLAVASSCLEMSVASAPQVRSLHVSQQVRTQLLVTALPLVPLVMQRPLERKTLPT